MSEQQAEIFEEQELEQEPEREPEQEPEQETEQQAAPEPVNPIPAKKLAEQIQAELPQEEKPQPKRGRGRPRKEPEQPPAAPIPPAPQPEPAKPAAKAKKKPPLPDIGAAVAPQLDEKRKAQIDAVKGLLQLQASKIASLACLAIGWDPLNDEESVLVDAEFEGWTPPEEMRKVVVVGIVALPRALADNRVRKMIGMSPIGGGDAPAERAAEIAASAPAPVAPPPVAPPAQAPEPVADKPAEEQTRSAAASATSPLFTGQGPVSVPRGFV